MAVEFFTSKQVVLEKASRYSTVTMVPYILFSIFEAFRKIWDHKFLRKKWSSHKNWLRKIVKLKFKNKKFFKLGHLRYHNEIFNFIFNFWGI